MLNLKQHQLVCQIKIHRIHHLHYHDAIDTNHAIYMHVCFADHDQRHALPILYHILAASVYDLSFVDRDYVAIVGHVEI